MMDGMEKVMEKGTCLTLSTDNLSHLWPITGGRAFLNVERLTDQEAKHMHSFASPKGALCFSLLSKQT